MTECSVEAIASEANCAKGLVNYHFQSKRLLLQNAARRIGERRAERRLHALSHGGTEAIDALWETLEAEVDSGEALAWLALQGDPRTLQASSLSNQHEEALGRAAAQALDLESGEVPAPTLVAALEGFQLQLLRGASPAHVREGYDAFWLAVLPIVER